MKSVTKILKNQLTRQHTPSVQYAFFDYETLLFEFNDGMADIENNVSIDENHTQHIYSITKTFTALAILQLVEKGEIALNSSVAEYLPEFHYGAEITIQQLLNHSSGMPNPIPISWIHLEGEHEEFNQRHFLEDIFAKNAVIRFNPNEKFAYSNLGYVMLGKVIEKASGTTYESYVQKNILNRLNLNESDLGFTIPNIKNHAIGYQRYLSITNLMLGLFIDKSKYVRNRVGVWQPFNTFYVNGSAYGGLIGTTGALVKYVQELLKIDNCLIGPDAQTILFKENHTTRGVRTGMCASWFTDKLNGIQYFAHAGGGGGYYSEIRLYPSQRKGSVIRFNRTGLKDERFLNKLDGYFVM